ncbi:hypothetical protein [Rivularia sp. UHCC 0363]|uniref:hypothetical protein n=1 Tax=Rivularia sp. UHCC 0363 TaxID=3110244 RepID=UPI002B1F81F1|nr:hypothetical protein [Rivularia sp. UHCC 0363]MEA5597373.1 hypothetical protein [Rivularia sp. UHCC 0363]
MTRTFWWSLPLFVMLVVPHPVRAQESEPPEEPVEEFVDEPAEPADPETVTTDPNPLNPAGESLDALIQMQVNVDLWSTMQGELPCLEATESCIRQLQEMAIGNAPALRAIDERIELINEKIDTARANNQQTINLGLFEPALQYFLKVENVPAVAETRDSSGRVVTQGQAARTVGLVDRVIGLFTGSSTLSTINDILSVIGVPLFQAIAGGSPETQQREIAIADLQVKIAEVENKRGELAENLREQVILQMLDFDTIRREFQIGQEVAKRQQLQLQIVEQNYRFAVGNMDTPQFLAQINSLDRTKADTFRAWSKLRSQLVRVKLTVLGAEQ